MKLINFKFSLKCKICVSALFSSIFSRTKKAVIFFEVPSTNTNARMKRSKKSEVPVQEGVVSIPESGPRMLVLTDVGEAGWVM